MSIINPKAKKNLGRDLKFQVTRVPIFVWIGKEKEAHKAFAFVSDIKKKGLTIFFTKKIPLHQLVLIAFEKEKNQPFQMKIVSNRSVGDNNPSNNRGGYTWKCGMIAGSASEQEVTRYLAYYENLRASIAITAKDIDQPNYKITEGNADGSSGDMNIPGLDGIDAATAAPAAESPAPASSTEAAPEATPEAASADAPAAETPPATNDEKKDAA